MFSFANNLSLLRLVLAPILAWCIVSEQTHLSLIVFVVGVVSDVFDGKIARDRGTVTRLGGVLDHAADCFFVVCAFFAFGSLGVFPWFLAPLVVVAFLQYVLDSGVFKNKQLVSSRLGRWNGIAYFILVGIPVVQIALGLDWVSNDVLFKLGAAMCIMTVVSIGERLLRLMQPGPKGTKKDLLP